MTADVKAQAEALLNGMAITSLEARRDYDGDWAIFRGVRNNNFGVIGTPNGELVANGLYEGDARMMAAAPTLARQVVELAGEVERLREALMHAAPMLRMGITYNQKSAHAAHALPGSRDRQRYESEASDALFRLRYDFIQDGAERALAALATQDEE